MTENIYKFDIPAHNKSIIKVIGVGGGGSNAVNHMFGQGIKDVEFAICNTDVQALKSSPVPNKLQLGANGLGAGANPEKGRIAAMESREEIRDFLSDNTKMVFITAGMGGGTGTGAAPVIAKIAKELDILTVGIVTAPFSFEGKRKRLAADEGIAALKEHCDTVLVILNDKLEEIYENLSLREAFGQADNILATGAKSIAEIITETRYVNVDFEDVRTVLKDSGAAVMGSAIASGENRAKEAAEEALNSPLLDNTDILGAQKILLSITFGEQAELKMNELSEITNYIEEKAGDEAEMIWGQGPDPSLGESIRVTVIATGFESRNLSGEVVSKKVIDLESERTIAPKEKEQVYVKPQVNYIFENPTPKPAVERVEPKPYVAPQDTYTPPSNVQQASLFSYEEPRREVRFTAPEEKPVETNVPQNRFQEEDSREHLSKEIFNAQAQQRREKLKNLSASYIMDKDDFKERLDVPAYERKQVTLKDVPHSSERNVSRFSLTDDSEILGNNKFLHDQAD